MYKTIPTQTVSILRLFKNDTIEGLLANLKYDTPQFKEGTVPLLVLPPSMISTKELFDHIDLGYMAKNTWFLDLIHMYDIIKDIPTVPYVLPNVNVRSSRLVPSNYSSYDFTDPRPLTFHETVTLGFQMPTIFTEKISGMQAYGSRFAASKSDTRNADTDDTLEIYRKGDPGEGLLKLAREHHRYTERNKIIPFVEQM